MNLSNGLRGVTEGAGRRELAEVELAMKRVKDRRMYERYQALYLHLKGYSLEQIADVQNRHVKTIKSHVKAYAEGGIAALDISFSPGAPQRMTESQVESLAQIINGSSPKRRGYSTGSRWTLQAIASCILAEFGLRYSLKGVSKLLQRHGVIKDIQVGTVQNVDETRKKFSTKHRM